MAERVGFEPTKDLTLCRFSRPVHSTRLCHLSAKSVGGEFSPLPLLKTMTYKENLYNYPEQIASNEVYV
jgi:hypothetical protein